MFSKKVRQVISPVWSRALEIFLANFFMYVEHGQAGQAEFTLHVLRMFYDLCVISLSAVSCGCQYAPHFILQTRTLINEHTHRCPRWESGRVWVQEALPVIKPIFRRDRQHIIILVSLSLVITRHSPWKLIQKIDSPSGDSHLICTY